MFGGCFEEIKFHFQRSQNDLNGLIIENNKDHIKKIKIVELCFNMI